MQSPKGVTQITDAENVKVFRLLCSRRATALVYIESGMGGWRGGGIRIRVDVICDMIHAK